MKMASRALRVGVALATSIASFAGSSSARAAEIYVRAFGPLERAESSGALTIVGQSFTLAADTDAIVDGKIIPHAASLIPFLASNPALSVGVLSVGPGLSARRLIVDTHAPYVAGSSLIAATGTVAFVDR